MENEELEAIIKDMFSKIERKYTGISFVAVLIGDNIAEVYLEMGNIENYRMNEISDLFNSINDIILTRPLISDIRVVDIFKGEGANKWILHLTLFINVKLL